MDLISNTFLQVKGKALMKGKLCTGPTSKSFLYHTDCFLGVSCYFNQQ